LAARINRHRVLIASVVVSCALLACSEATHYQWLQFFFDGVPEPGTEPTVGYPAPAGMIFDGAEGSLERPGGYTVYSHTPFKEGRCADCHDVLSGQLARTPAHGLCLLCHVDLLRGLRFEHGPVAADDCTVCHHPHVSRYEYVLVHDPHVLCFYCHRREDLSAGEHHADLDGAGCVNCHDPHGGSDRYFLRRTES
jgi:predicted CXXCH cytochrome family protein